MLTLQDLKWIVKKPEKEKKLPTARYLLEQGKCVVSMENGGEVQLLVFREGYALYRIGKYTTVFRYIAAEITAMRMVDGRSVWTHRSLNSRNGMCVCFWRERIV